MKDISQKDKELAQAMAEAYAKKLKTRSNKTDDGESLQFSGSVNFSGDGGDTGKDSGLLPQFAKEREETAFAELRKIATQEELKKDGRLTRYIERRNSQILASKRIATQRFGFTKHPAKNDN